MCLRLCLVPIKYFPKNKYFSEILFSEKENIFRLFGCLGIRFTENQFRCLVRSNIFTENALHSQATQFSIHFLNCKHVENESIPHTQKKQNPAKKFIKSSQIERKRKRERRLGSINGDEGEIVRRRRDRATLESDWCYH